MQTEGDGEAAVQGCAPSAGGAGMQAQPQSPSGAGNVPTTGISRFQWGSTWQESRAAQLWTNPYASGIFCRSA